MSTNTDTTSAPPLTVDPDIHCAVGVVSKPGKRCMVRLSCGYHSVEQKRAVTDRSRPFDELVRQQPVAVRNIVSTPAKKARSSPIPVVIDLDVHCAVPDEDGTRCSRVLTCTKHKAEEKETVAGRSAAYRIIHRLYGENHRVHSDKQQASNSVNVDTQCAVRMDDGRCTRALSCSVHDTAQKLGVEGRCLPFSTLLVLQINHTSSEARSLTGYGLVLAPARDDPKISSLRRRYRRTGLQLASLDHDAHGDTGDPHYSMLQPTGENLARVRQLLFGGGVTPSQGMIDGILPKPACRKLEGSRAAVFEDTENWYFGFVPEEKYMQDNIGLLQGKIRDGRVRDSCIITAPKNNFSFSKPQADGLLRWLRRLMERVPLELHMMSSTLRKCILLHAIAQAGDNDTGKTVYTIKKAVVDNKASLIMPISIVDPNTGNMSTARDVMLALPFNNEPREKTVPPPQSCYKFLGQDYGQPWLGVDIPQTKQQKLFQIAAYTVSTLHLRAVTIPQLNITLAQISRDFDVAILTNSASEAATSSAANSLTPPDGNGILAVYDSHTSTVYATAEARALAEWFPDITNVVNDLSGHLVVQCINMRYRHTQDSLLAWADGSNAADMHQKYGMGYFSANCMCSESQASVEMHQCTCGARCVCKDMSRIHIDGELVLLCSKCVDLRADMPQFAFQQLSNPRIKYTFQTKEYTRLRSSLNTEINKEHNIVYPNKTQPTLRHQEMVAAYSQLDRYFSEPGGQWQWNDVYLTSATTEQNNPMMASIEAFLPQVFENSRPRTHIARNMGVTKLYANKLCGSHPPVLLKLFHGLDAAQSDRDRADFVERIDHLHIIRSQIPWYINARMVDATYDGTFRAAFEEQCKSGCPTATACERVSEQRKLWGMTCDGYKSIEEKDLPQINEVRQYLLNLDEELPQPMRRINGVPYPLSGGPDPENWSWNMLYSFVNMHLSILTKCCNSRFITTFTISRLVCVFCRNLSLGRAVQPSQLLDVPVSAWKRHPLHCSAGKEDHAKEMGTGFEEGKEISAANFQAERSNLCFEPWLCNSAKGHVDAYVDTIRKDFRQNLRQEVQPYWQLALPAIDKSISEQYIGASKVSYDDESDGYQGESTGGQQQQQQTYPESVSHRNMANLSQTCYMSSVIQTYHTNENVRSFVQNNTNFVYKEHTGLEKAQFLPHDEIPSEVTDEDYVQFRQMRRASQRLLIPALGALFGRLATPGERLPANETQIILRRIHAIDDRWENKSNESAHLLDFLLDNIVSAADRSDPLQLNQIEVMGRQQEADNKEGKNLINIAADVERWWQAFVRQGHDTDLTPQMYSQTMQEVPCADEDCTVVSRGFEHAHITYLDFPSEMDLMEEYDLETLLSKWSADDQDHRCEANDSHPRALFAYRCFTKLANYITFALRRGFAGVVNIFNTVNVSEELDMRGWCDRASMPSNTRQQIDVEMEPQDEAALPYDLAAVVTWKNHHYIAYVRDWDAAEAVVPWIVLNDLDTKARRKTPFQGIAQGELVHYATYKKRADADHGPGMGAGGAEQASDQDGDMMMDDGLKQQASDQDGDMAMGDGLQQETPGTAGGHVKAGRPRPISSDAESLLRRASLPRGEYHGDVASARSGHLLAAREANVALEEARIARASAALEHREEDVAAREQKLDELQAQADLGAELQLQIQQRNLARDGYQNDIQTARNNHAAREAQRASQVEQYDTDLARLRPQLQALQAQVANLEQGRQQTIATAQDDRVRLDQEIVELQTKLLSLLE